MHSVPTIETERLFLRPYRRDDFSSYCALFGDEEVTRYTGGVPYTREQSWTRFLRQVGMWHYFGFGFFAIQDKQTGAFIGEAGFHEAHRQITPSLEGTMETGWAISPKKSRPRPGDGSRDRRPRLGRPSVSRAEKDLHHRTGQPGFDQCRPQTRFQGILAHNL